MASYSSNDFRSGLKIIFEGEPYTIESSEFVKPGKGQPFVRVKMRRLLTGTRVEKTFKSTDSVKKANILEMSLSYSYSDGDFYYFMDPDSFEQYQVEPKVLRGVSHWIQYNDECIVTFWNEKVITVQPPKFIELEVTETEPGIKGDTASAGGGKSATLSTGVTVRVPLFVQQGEIVRVDTRSGEYVSRIK